MPAQLADLAHQLPLRERDVEVRVAVLNFRHQVIRSDDVGPGLLSGARGFALGEDRHADGLAQAMGQVGRAADLLVGVPRVKVGADVQFHGLVELGGGVPLDTRDRFGEWDGHVGVVVCDGGAVAFFRVWALLLRNWR